MSGNDSGSLPFEPPEKENIRLHDENARLRRLLAVHGIPISQPAPENPPPAITVETAPPVDKEERARKGIALFRSRFRGREDVYAQRWESADGRCGYAPAATKNWKSINKSRPEDRKKVDQKTRKFLPLIDVVIEPSVRNDTFTYSKGSEVIGPDSSTPRGRLSSFAARCREEPDADCGIESGGTTLRGDSNGD